MFAVVVVAPQLILTSTQAPVDGSVTEWLKEVVCWLWQAIKCNFFHPLRSFNELISSYLLYRVKLCLFHVQRRSKTRLNSQTPSYRTATMIVRRGALLRRARVTLSADDAGGGGFQMLSRLSTDPEGCESVLWSFPLRSLPRPGNNSAAPLITLVHYCYCIIVTASPRARGGSRRGKEPHSSDWRRHGNEADGEREARRFWPPDCTGRLGGGGVGGWEWWAGGQLERRCTEPLRRRCQTQILGTKFETRTWRRANIENVEMYWRNLPPDGTVNLFIWTQASFAWTFVWNKPLDIVQEITSHCTGEKLNLKLQKKTIQNELNVNENCIPLFLFAADWFKFQQSHFSTG